MDSVFDARLDEFRRYQATPWGRLRYEQVVANLARHLPVRPLTVLDVGGGNGADAVRLAGLGHHVTLLDISQAALDEATASAGRHGCAELIEVRLADAADLAVLALRQSFDVVLCHNVLQYVPSRANALAEMVAVLSPGGLLSVLMPNPPVTL